MMEQPIYQKQNSFFIEMIQLFLSHLFENGECRRTIFCKYFDGILFLRFLFSFLLFDLRLANKSERFFDSDSIWFIGGNCCRYI